MAERLPLSAISRYLNSLQTAEAPFTQITEDGTISTGKLYIKRPGRVRFEYDPPEEAIVVELFLSLRHGGLAALVGVAGPAVAGAVPVPGAHGARAAARLPRLKSFMAR